MQVNGEYIDEEKFVQYLGEIRGAVETCERSFFGRPTYFEVSIALALYAFAREGVDLAIVEVGCGGLYDGTNVLDRADTIRVLTREGFDHEAILGDTLVEIVYNSVGIIGMGNSVISLYHDDPVLRDIVEYRARSVGAELTYVHPEETVSIVARSESGMTVHIRLPGLVLPECPTSLVGDFQAENLSVALTAVTEARRIHGIPLSPETIRSALTSASFVGRCEIYAGPRGSRLILDGAHNPQKMAGLVASLRALYGDTTLDWMVAFKAGKNIESMLERVVPLARRIHVCAFDMRSDTRHTSQVREDVMMRLATLGHTDTTMCDDPLSLLSDILTSDTIVIATGSLYFLACLYPVVDILRERGVLTRIGPSP